MTRRRSRAPGVRPVAVVGLSARFPGADGAEAFWDLLREGSDAVGPVPLERWDGAELYDPEVGRPGRIASRHAGLIDGFDRFDAALFGISAREASTMDPQQRLALELAWHALEDAGLAPERLASSATGVFLGISASDYARLLARDVEALDGHAVTGSALSIAANRISYALGLEGPSLAVDTGCSSSATAIHLACQSLRLGESDLALAGGVNLLISPEASISLSRAGMLAPDGRCKAFAAAADGYGRGEGGGFLVLEPLDAALAAGHPVRAVILGSAVNQDGASNGLTAPNPRAQEALLRAAYAAAGVDPARVDYVEAHGTGTPLGDPIEVKALAAALGAGRDRARPLRLGSVKSNVGHLEAAAGVAGAIKTVLALERGLLPPSLHCRETNPLIPFGELPILVQTAADAWPRYADPPLAGVSSFSFGGTNVHLVLQGAPAPPPPARAERPAANPFRVLALSAATEPSLQAQARRLADLLAPASPGGTERPDLDEVARSLLATRARLPHRAAVVATDGAAAVGALQALAAGRTAPEIVSAPAGSRVRRAAQAPVGFLFTGQGSQYPGMARGLYEASPRFRRALEECAAVADRSLERPLLDVLFHATEGDGSPLDQTVFAQPALFAVEYGLAQLWRAWGVEPHAVLGHSVGEYVAAAVAGAAEAGELLELVVLRAGWMQELPPGGGMAAVGAGEERVREALAGLEDRVELAAVNAPAACSVSGDLAGLDELAARLERDGVTVRRLPVSHAFHSSRVEPMLERLEEAARRIAWRPLRLPLASNLTGEVLAPGEVLDSGYWRRHTREAVRFADGARALSAAGVRLFLEMGPRPVLTSFGKRARGGGTGRARRPHWIASLRGRRPDTEELARALGELWVHGVEPDWRAVDGGAERRRVSLPLYPFERVRYWLEAPAVLAAPVSAAGARASAPRVEPLPAAAAGRRESVLAALVGEVATLLQCTPDEVDPTMPFLEMGADSIVMIDAVRRIERLFGVRLRIGQLFEELSTLDALADHLAGTVTRDGAGDEGSEADPPPAPAPPSGPAAARPSAEPDPRSILPSFRPTASAVEHLDARQRDHLDELTRRFAARTSGSKRWMDRHRPALADSRASAGFRPSIKEMLYPLVGAGGSGSRVYDIDGNEYVDLTMGFGVHLFGHRPPFVEAALARQLEAGIELGPQSALAGRVAERVAELTGLERVAFCNSGTEAVMAALRLARAHTGRRRVALFRGSYHGHADGTLAVPGEGGGPGGGGPAVPAVSGVPPGAVADLLVLDYGTEEALETLTREAPTLAGVLVEPVQSRRPDLQPRAFLVELRRITAAAGAALIFDEMITGFRLHAGGAQAFFGVRADLATYGKIAGGGLPIGIVAGRDGWADGIDGGTWSYGDASYPAVETTFFAGTFSKHPLTMAAADAVLGEIARCGPTLYEELNERTAYLERRLEVCVADAFPDGEAPLGVARCGSLFRFAFRRNLDLLFFHLLDRGVFVWEGRNCFLSTAHDEGDLDRVVGAVADSLAAMRSGGFLPGKSRDAGAGARRVPLSDSQRQLWALAQVSREGKRAYDLSMALELTGPLDPGALRRALDHLVDRHEALRTVFPDDGEGQRVLEHAAVAFSSADLSGDAGEPLPEAGAARLLENAGRDFALDTEPPFAADLVRLGPERHRLQLTAHHLVADGLSLGLVVDELGRLYGHHMEASDPALEPARSFREWIAWHESHREAPEMVAAEAYWRRVLEDGPPALELPGDRLRPPVRRFAGGRVRRTLGGDTRRAFARAAAAAGATLSMGLLGAFALLLHRHSGQDDLAIGLPTSGRPIDGPLVGYCTHLLPIRSRLAEDETTGALVRRFRGAVLDAMEHEAYPFARLLERLAGRRDPGRPSLVSVTFNLDRPPAAPRFAGLQARFVPVPVAFVRFDLALNATDLGDGLVLELDFDADLFDPATAEALLETYATVVEGWATGAGAPGTPVRELPLLPPARRRQVVSSAPPPAPDDGLCRRFDRWVRETPERVAVSAPDGELSFGTLAGRARRLARALVRRGAGPEAPVVLVTDRTASSVTAMLAVLEAGSAFVPVDAATPAERAATLVRDSGARLVVVAATSGAAASAVLPAERVPLGSLLDEAPDEPRALARGPEDGAHLAYVLYTSGSTGRPKGVAVEHRQVVAYLDALAGRLGLEPGLTCAALASFQVDLGLTALLPALFLGGRLLLVPERDASDPLALGAALARDPVDLLKVTPSHLAALLDGPDPRAVLPRRWLVLGGETLPPSLLGRLRELAPGLRVVNHYGPTETTVGATAIELDRASPPDPRRRVPIGRALPHARVSVVGPDGQALPPGFPGEVVIGGTGVSRGYLGDPRRTAAAFPPDPASPVPGCRRYRTGDLGRVRADGLIEFLGRRDDQVKLRGHRIEPGEVGAALRGLPGIAAAAALVAEGPHGSPRLMAYAVPERGPGEGGPPTEATVLEGLRRLLPGPMVPSSIVFLDALPLGPSGKLDRSALPPVPSARGATAGPVAPRTAVERTLLELWRGLLPGAAGAGVADDFFTLGGDSVVAIQLAGRAAGRGLRIRAADLFTHRTVAELASAATEAAPPAASVEPPPGPFVPTPSQRRFLEAAGPRPDHWNMSLLLEGPRSPAHAVLARALGRLLDHHDALRTRFRRAPDGAWRGEVVQPGGAVPLIRVDLSALDPRPARRALGRAADRVQESLDLAAGPVVRFALFDLGAGRPSQLLAVVHHLAIDGVSWSTLVEDLGAAWLAESERKAWRPRSNSMPFAAWAHGLAERARLAFAGDAEAWLATLDAVPAPAWPSEMPGAGDLERDARVLRLELDPERTASLVGRAPEAYRVGPLEALLAATVEAIAPWSGTRRLLVELEGHGREPFGGEVDLSRTVGYFTAHYPVLLDLEGRVAPGAALLAVKERLARVPDRGPGFELLMHGVAEPDVRRRLAAVPRPAVRVNYLGRYDRLVPEDAPFRPVSGGGVVGRGRGRERHPETPLPQPLAIDALIAEGRLRMDLTWASRRLDRERAEALGRGLVGALEALADHCAAPGAGALSPADFPLAGLSDASLTSLVRRLASVHRWSGSAHREIEDVYPLSPIQEGMWLQSVTAPGAGVYVDQHACRLRGEVDAAALEHAWSATIAAHPALRSAFVAIDAGAPLQVVLRHAPLPAESLDWSGWSEAEQERRLAELLERDAAAGFELARAPLLRLRWIRLDTATTLMLWTHHHLTIDGWSSGLLVEEVLERYRAGDAGSGRPAPLPYRRYVEWLAGRDTEAERAFWSERLAGRAGPTPLGIDGARADPEPGFGVTRRELPATRAEALEALASRCGVTLNTVLQAAWAVLLARYGGERDVLFGVTVAGRPPELPGVERMIGNFVNVVPLRLDVDPSRRLEDWLPEVQTAGALLLEHAATSLVEVRRWAGLPADRPLFSSALVFENYPVSGLAGHTAADLQVTEVRSFERSELPWTLTVEPLGSGGPAGSGLALVLAYDRSRFDRKTCDEVLARLAHLLKEMARCPGSALGSLRLLRAPDRRTPAGTAGAESEDTPARQVAEELSRWAAATPDAVALSGAARSVTYRDLDRRADRIAHGLAELAPVTAGSAAFVALLLDSGVDVVAAMLGVLRAGHAFVCLDPEAPPARLRGILEETGAAVVIGDPDAVAALGPGRLALAPRELERMPPTGPGTPVEPGAPAYAVYTSGSTGHPKGMVHTQESLAQITAWHVRELGITRESRVAQWAVPSYDAAYGEVFPAIAAGATLCPLPPALRLDTAGTARWLARSRVSLFQTVPSVLSLLLDEPGGTEALAGLDRLLLAGEALPPALAARALESLPPTGRLYNLYGPSECFLATFQPVDRPAPGAATVPVGRPISGRRVTLLDTAGLPVPAGLPGEVFLAGRHLCRGYLCRPAETAERFVPAPPGEGAAGERWLRTGDLARWTPGGALCFCGRTDDQVKVRGMRVELGEIAVSLRRLPGVAEAVVLLAAPEATDPGPSPADRVVAYAVARDPGSPPAEADVLARLRRELPHHMVPAAVVFLSALPRLPSGKVDRSSLPPWVPGPSAGEDNPAAGVHEPPASRLEQTLADLWSELLGHRTIDRRASFFELGGHSLLAGRLVNALRERGVADLSVRTVFAEPTLAALASAIEERAGSRSEEVAAVLGYVESLSDEEVRTMIAERRTRAR